MAQEKKVYPDINQAIVVGAVIRQDLRYTPEGKPILRVVVGVAEEEGREYVPIKVLGARAEELSDRLAQKGSGLGLWVQGRLSYYRKDDLERVDLLADRVEVIRIGRVVTRPDRPDPFLVGGQNRVLVSGMVATEPEPYTLPKSGERVLRFRLAIRLDSEANGFVSVSAYDQLAAEAEFSRGERVVVVGRYRSYSTAGNSNGKAPERRYHSEIRAQEIWPLVLPGRSQYPQAAPKGPVSLDEEFPPAEDLFF